MRGSFPFLLRVSTACHTAHAPVALAVLPQGTAGEQLSTWALETDGEVLSSGSFGDVCSFPLALNWPTSQGTFQSQAKQDIWSSSLYSFVGCDLA